MIKRNTVQVSRIYQTVQRLKCHPTANDIYTEIQKDSPSISRGTVYRNLDRLAKMGEIKKVEVPGGPEHFDSRCDDHYHIKCNMCNRIYDVDMNCLSDLTDMIDDKQGFQFQGYDVFFNGICPECNKKKEVI